MRSAWPTLHWMLATPTQSACEGTVLVNKLAGSELKIYELSINQSIKFLSGVCIMCCVNVYTVRL